MLDHIHLDLHGPWHCGNKKFYIWGATCAFSKYLFCGITRSKKASSAFKFLMNKVIFFAGVPNTITSDRGAEFSTKAIDYLHKALGIQRIKTSAYHPSSNSSIERYWRSLDQQLRKSTTNYADIEDILIPASFALNSTVNSTTGYAPNYLLMAFTPQTATLFNKFPPIPADVQQNDPDMILEREQRRLKAFQEVHKRIQARTNYKKAYQDGRGTQTVREVGDQCLIKNHYIPIHANKKIVPRWKPATKGLPYQIIKASEDGLNLKSLDPTTGKQIDCHTENTRKLPGGKIYPLPKEGPTAKDNPFERITNTKKSGTYVREARANMKQPKNHKDFIQHPFLTSESEGDSEEDDTSSVEQEDSSEDCAAPNGCKKPTGNAISWVQCDACLSWTHFICIDLSEMEINDSEPFYCNKCTPQTVSTVEDAIFTDDQQDNASSFENANLHTKIADWRHDARQLLPPPTSSINASPPAINKEAPVNSASDTVTNEQRKQEDLQNEDNPHDHNQHNNSSCSHFRTKPKTSNQYSHS